MANKLIGFDLDDTLMYNHHYYSLALADLVKHTISTLGPRTPNAQTILELQSKKDIDAVKASGFTMERFPQSCADTYLEIAKALSINAEKASEGAKQAYEIGRRVFDSNFWIEELMPKATKTLNYVKEQGDELFLLTAGDPRVQNKKIEFYGLSRWFGNEMYVVPHHKKEKLVEIISKRNKKNVWFVGNSARSDIAPALEIGIGAVYIPQETWAYDKHDLALVDQSRLVTLDEIGEIPNLYSSIFN
jgi:putative hydrolase of the HAD superfamily